MKLVSPRKHFVYIKIVVWIFLGKVFKHKSFRNSKMSRRNLVIYISGAYLATGTDVKERTVGHIAEARIAALQVYRIGYSAITPHLNSMLFEEAEGLDRELVHKAQALRDTFTVGTMLPLTMYYMRGYPSDWSHSHAFLYDTGVVQLVNIIPGSEGKWKLK